VEGGRVRNHRRSVHHAFAASPPDLTIERIPCSLVGLPAGVQRCTSDQKPTDDQDRNKIRLPSRVSVNRRGVEDDPIEVDIARVVAQRVEAGPAAQGRGVVTVPEVVQAADIIKPAALVQVVAGVLRAAKARDLIHIEDHYLPKWAINIAFHKVFCILRKE